MIAVRLDSRRSPGLLGFLLLLLLLAYSSMSLLLLCEAFLVTAPHHHYHRLNIVTAPFTPTALSVEPSKSKAAATAVVLEQDDDDQEMPAIAGSEFFGGNKQKEELYDPVAEAQADVLLLGRDQQAAIVPDVYSRFDDAQAFPDSTSRDVAESLQQQIIAILNPPQDSEEQTSTSFKYSYASTVQWTSPFSASQKQESPLQQLQDARNFYNHVDLAIVSAAALSSSSSNPVEANSATFQWELSVSWPTFWEPRILIAGTSQVTWKNHQIIQQVDTLDQSSSLVSIIAGQILPRFWDTYHIGMTPSAELQPAQESKSLFRNYKLYTLPPRLVYAPSILDTGSSRQDANAQTVPNHAFSTVIKTMGPKKQRYVTASPIQVQLLRNKDDKTSRLQWTIPLSVELQANTGLPLPGEDPETLPESYPGAKYEFQSKRKVATFAYGGCPQDEEVAQVRKQLYEQVMRDGHKPKIDEAGRPVFFFWQHDVKACYTEGGLGMAVYEWRPKFVKANEVGIELEVDDMTLVKNSS